VSPNGETRSLASRIANLFLHANSECDPARLPVVCYTHNNIVSVFCVLSTRRNTNNHTLYDNWLDLPADVFIPCLQIGKFPRNKNCKFVLSISQQEWLICYIMFTSNVIPRLSVVCYAHNNMVSVLCLLGAMRTCTRLGTRGCGNHGNRHSV
jgi:hypothetical protein